MLRVSGLSCERDDRILFENLSYDFHQNGLGGIIQLEGRNGAGKTTLLRILAGLYHSYSGSISWEAKDIETCRENFYESLLFIGHKSAVKSTLTPLENLRFLIGLKQRVSTEQLISALSCVGLEGYEDVQCRNLSAGQQRRVALARLYLSNASIWILDEIFTAIDKQGVAQLEKFLSTKAKEGVTIILTTHHQLGINDYRVLNLSTFSGDQVV